MIKFLRSIKYAAHWRRRYMDQGAELFAARDRLRKQDELFLNLMLKNKEFRRIIGEQDSKIQELTATLNRYISG